jgi:16S rRNA (guanine966-N2)-methyltransferase
MRITGGKHKNRKIFCPEGDRIRPTSDRMRQTVFNILHHAGWLGDFELNGARVLDLYCGTGALGIEALSNGAIHCTFVDRDIMAVTENTAWIDNTHKQILKQDVLKIGEGQGDINLVFIDPPYRQDLIESTLGGLVNKNWLADGAIIIVESEKEFSLKTDQYELLDKRSQSQSNLNFLQYIA